MGGIDHMEWKNGEKMSFNFLRDAIIAQQRDEAGQCNGQKSPPPAP